MLSCIPVAMGLAFTPWILTDAEFLGGAIAREAKRAGVPAPLHTALYRLIKAKEASWAWKNENVLETV